MNEFNHDFMEQEIIKKMPVHICVLLKDITGKPLRPATMLSNICKLNYLPHLHEWHISLCIYVSVLRTLEHFNKAAIRDFSPFEGLGFTTLSDTCSTYMALMTGLKLLQEYNVTWMSWWQFIRRKSLLSSRYK